MAQRRKDNYSAPHPGPGLEQWIDTLVEQHPGSPTVDLLQMPFPKIARATIGERRLKELLADAAIPGAERPPRSRGMPRRNLARALVLAALRDIAGGIVESDEPRLFPVAEVLSHGQDTYRSRTADRYRQDGRRLWAELGAWPWAVAQDGADPRGGRLPRGWWRRTEYADALRSWTHQT